VSAALQGGTGGRHSLSARSNDMVQHSDQGYAGGGHLVPQPGFTSGAVSQQGQRLPAAAAAGGAGAGGAAVPLGKAAAPCSRSLKVDTSGPRSGCSAGVIRAYNLDVLLG
jgi:hypothetical protein